jgi:RNA polymerase sigma-70 factor (ECF subfamily)
MESQPAMVDTDRELAEAVARYGDESAFRELYRRHTPRLLALVARLLGPSDDDAEDAVQEAWIRACEGLGRFRWQSAFGTWVAGIAINVARDVLRRRSRWKTTELGEDNDPRPGRVHTAEARIDLEGAIRALPDGCRVVLVLHDVEGMTHGDIAGRLGIAEGTSKSQLSNARRLLRSYLGTSTENDHA